MQGSRLRRNAVRGSRLAALAFLVALTALLGLRAAGLAGAAVLDNVVFSSAVDCEEATVIAPVVADTWLDENSPSSAKGSDSVLSVDAGSVNVDTGDASGRARALFRFAMPSGVPEGCVVESARLFVFSSEESVGTRVEAVRLASAWSENAASWSNQPGTTGDAVRIWSREGYMQWNVAAQVQAMLESGTGHGFLLRDAAEGAETGGGGHGFYSREKGDSNTAPELVIRFAAPASEEPPGPPQPPEAATVRCGQVLTQSTLVANDLSGCLGDGLVIGAPRIIVDLGGHTIDGTGLGSGVRNEGYAAVTVRNGTVEDFDYGVQLYPETTLNVVEQLTFRLNQVAAVELFDVSATEIRGNRLDGNAGGILLVSGTRDSVAADNTITGNGGAGLLVQDATGNRLEHNSVAGGGDLGIGLERSSGNSLIGNTSSGNSDGGIEIHAASHGNRIEGNTVTESGDHGILVSESDRNELIDNVAHFMSDSGITLNSANDGVVRGNDVRFNTGGLQMDGSSRNVVESNDASETSGIGIELGGGSMENVLEGNTADANGAQGIYVSDDAADPLGNPVPDLGNLILANTASRNQADGIVVAKGGHTITANVTRDNLGWGINAALVGSIDGSGNVAVRNGKPEQCVGVVCKEEWVPPETEVTGGPAPFTRSRSAQFSFTASDDTTPVTALRFACSLDGGAFAACNSPRLYTSLADGLHTFAVRATDRAGNTDPSPATHLWTIDSTPPDTTITEAPVDPTNQTSASLSFTGSDNASADSALTFECRLDDAAAWASCASPADLTGLAEGAHRFEVRAVDGAGNADPSSATSIWTIDTTPPDTTIVSGPSPTTNRTSATFDLSAEPGATFACSLDGAAFAPCAASTTYLDLSDGEHTFEARATDRAGNVGGSPALRTWTVDTVPPETMLGERPADATSNTTATFSFTAGEPGSFECSLDGASFAACSSPASYPALAEGPHRFEVRAVDRAGNVDASAAGFSWVIDVTPPETVVDSGPVDPSNSSSAEFSLSADEDAKLECSLDGAPYEVCSSPAGYEGLAEGGHAFDARAIDRAGNVDPTPARAIWTIDLTPPETTIEDAPADPTNDTSPGFTFTAGELSSFECRLDGGSFAACSSPAEYRDLGEGAHLFEVRAIDRAGNVEAEPAAFAWTVDLTPPQTSIDASPRDPSNSPAATFEFSADENATFECSLDGELFEACSSPKGYEDLAEGAHSFEVRAKDSAGNVDATAASSKWAIDLTPPQTTIDAQPLDPTNSTSAGFAFSAGEPASFECRLDGAPFADCSNPVSFEGLAEGAHAFDVRAVDRAGNADPTPARSTWTIDVTPPETTIEAQPADPTASASASFDFSAGELSSFECRLDGGNFVACASPASYEGLAEGRHRFEVRATDRAGNIEPSPALADWTVDLTPPETSIDSGPADPSNSSSAEFAFSADEEGSFVCSLDGAPFAACSSPTGYVGLGEGRHRFEVRAVDRAGNVDAEPAGFSWAIDRTPPGTTIDTQPADPTNSTSAGFAFSADEPASFECRLDGGGFVSCPNPTSYEGLAEGAHAFDVRAIDRAGNIAPTPARATWTIDLTAPQTVIDEQPSDPTNSSSATFAFSADEQATFVCSLDGAPFAACSSRRSYDALAEGRHSFEVRATDRVGNADPTAATYAWTVDQTTPQTTISTGPPDPTTRTSASFSFASDEPDSTFVCSLDGAPFAACGSSADYSGLEPGTHFFQVRATDKAGNTDPTPAGRSWTIDLTPPETAIDYGPADPTNTTSASFAFSAGEAAGFECRLDGGSFGACSSPHLYSGLAEGQHTFDVRAIDAAGNTDPSPARSSWTIDQTAPQTTIDSAPPATTSSTSAGFTFSVGETGATFECSLDGSLFAACSSPRNYTDLAVGGHEFRVRATDVAGNTDASPALYSWTIEPPPDPTAPETTIDSGPAAVTSSTSATFAFSSSKPNSAFACSLDGAAFAGCVSPRQYTNLASGNHDFRVRATDAAGNVDQTPAAYDWTIDTAPPETTITSGPPAASSSTTAAFSFTAGEPGSTFQCSLDGAPFAACQSPRAYTGLSNGAHQFRVSARDPAGNVDLTPATYSWTVDTIAPQTTITSSPPVLTSSANASFSFTASEAGSTFECSLDSAAFAVCSSPRQHASLAGGAHQFRVRATDAAGNVDATPATHSWTIDTVAPETTIDSGPPATTTSTSASFAFSANESGATFECSLDGAAFAVCTSPRQYTALPVGQHQFRVRARDAAGNTDASPATYSWTITPPSSTCPAPMTLSAVADAWIDENSPSANKGDDSILKVQSKGPRDNFRTLVRFTLPTLPPGCVLDTATLRLYSPSASSSQRTLQAFRLGGSWTEGGVTWGNAPQAAGSAVTTTSGSGYRGWGVGTLVQAMYSSGSNNGFLIKDANEGQDAEQQLHAREKGENVPQLVLAFKAP